MNHSDAQAKADANFRLGRLREMFWYGLAGEATVAASLKDMGYRGQSIGAEIALMKMDKPRRLPKERKFI